MDVAGAAIAAPEEGSMIPNGRVSLKSLAGAALATDARTSVSTG